MRRQGGEQQLAPHVQPITAKYARQRFDGQSVELIFAPLFFHIKGGLFFQTTMIQAAATGAVDLIQRRVIRQHLFGAAHAAAVFTDHKNIGTDRQQRQNIHQLELGFRLVLRPVIDKRVAVSDI